MNKILQCEHFSFKASVNVSRLVDIGRFAADIIVNCNECGQPFQFVGVMAGLALDQPTVSLDATELRVPIVPFGQTLPDLKGKVSIYKGKKKSN